MSPTVRKQVEELQRMKVKALREKYHEVFGEETRSFHRQFLVRRIAWRLQANEEGDLSERARRIALEIANDADLRIRAPKDFFTNGEDRVAERTAVSRFKNKNDNRAPEPGTVLRRTYKGRHVEVTVTDTGFEYAGRVFRSLSAAATEATGTRWNGYAFFGLARPKEASRA